MSNNLFNIQTINGKQIVEPNISEIKKHYKVFTSYISETKETFQSLYDTDAQIETVKCLLEKEFTAPFSEDICPCPVCFDRSLWNYASDKAAKLNRFCLWNDVIKRWESTAPADEQHPSISHNIKNYTFEKMENIYQHTNVNFFNYDATCEDCPPFYLHHFGRAFYKKYKNTNTISDVHSLCEIGQPKLALRAFSNIKKRMEIIASNIFANHEYIFEFKNDIIYSPIFDIIFSFPDKVIGEIHNIGNTSYITSISSYFPSAENGYLRLTNNLGFGHHQGTIQLIFTNIQDSNDVITCEYSWSIIIDHMNIFSNTAP